MKSRRERKLDAQRRLTKTVNAIFKVLEPLPEAQRVLILKHAAILARAATPRRGFWAGVVCREVDSEGCGPREMGVRQPGAIPDSESKI